MLEPVVIVIAFTFGLLFRHFGFPPLLGYLLAGFVAHGFGWGNADQIAPIADLGLMLLLFTIGLKLNIKEILAPQVWAVASLHMMIAVPLTALVIILSGLVFTSLALPDSTAAWALAFALSFSSTVFAVKIFDERGESAALHASIAIGILIIQDLIAVCYLAFISGKLPNLYAVGVFALPFLRPVLLKLLHHAGHGELLVLFGISMALGMAELFEFMQLKAGLGALIAGVILGNSSKSNELYKGLIDFKDIFLIGFFLQVGYNGLPSWEMLIVALVLCLLIFLRPCIYFFLLVAFKLRSRTAFLGGMSLFNYSEFGLIVATLAASSGLLPPQWVTALALAMALSFFIAIPFNTRIHSIYAKLSSYLQTFEREQRLPVEPAVELGNARIVVLGLGRVGYGAYQYLRTLYPDEVIGVEESIEKARERVSKGLYCIQGDASDRDFWDQAKLHERQLILACLSNHRENLEVVRLLKTLNYQGQLAVVSRFPDEQKELENLGCIAFNLYAEAGHGFAEHVLEQIQKTEDTKGTVLETS